MLILMRQLKSDKFKLAYVHIRAYSAQVRHTVDDHNTDSTFQLQNGLGSSAVSLLREPLASRTCNKSLPHCVHTVLSSVSDPVTLVWKQNDKTIALCSRTRHHHEPSCLQISSELIIPLGTVNGERLCSSVSCYEADQIHRMYSGSHYCKDVLSNNKIRSFCDNRSSLLHENGGSVLLCRGDRLKKRHLKYEENSSVNKTPENKSQLPSQQQLDLIRDNLAENFPKLFVKAHDYRIYRQDLIFENNLGETSTTTVGLTAYVIQVAKLRIYTHVRYANARLTILKITTHTSDGSVRVRWRLSGIPQIRAFMFWKFLPWSYNKAMTSQSEWVDGFSTFYVGSSDGLILKHRLDKVIPDEDLDVQKDKNLVEKLGLAPQ